MRRVSRLQRWTRPPVKKTISLGNSFRNECQVPSFVGACLPRRHTNFHGPNMTLLGPPFLKKIPGKIGRDGECRGQ